jgi:hypothetical protein
MDTKVVNRRYQEFDIYIGRPTRWGNPFSDGTREENIAKYRVYLWKCIQAGEVTIADLMFLRGKRLGCWCAPLPCHGDVLVKAIQWAESQ